MSSDQMNQIYEMSQTSDENDIKSNNHSINSRVNSKSINERRVLAPIDSKSRSITSVANRNNSKRFPFEQLRNNSNNNLKLWSFVSTGNTVKTDQEPIKSKANFVSNNEQKCADFQIYCDQSDNEIDSSLKENDFNISCDSIKDQENKGSKPTEQTDHSLIALNSLAIEEELNEELTYDQEITCEESFMMIETDEEVDEELEDESNSEQTSEVTRSFDATALSSCKEYNNEVHKYLLFYERKVMADPFYVAKQPEINAKMRSILIDWMVEVTEEYKLLDETLFLAVNYIDRFLSIMSVSRQSFQLLGTAALFIASKYEEIYPPDLGEFVYITDDSYSKLQILNMEKLILKALQFDVSPPTIYYFVEKFGSDLNLNTSVKHLSKYLCYLTLLESEPFLQYFPSEIAICSIILSAQTLGFREQISDDFIQKSVLLERQQNNGDVKNLLSDRQSCIEALHKMQHFASKHPQQAIQLKYASDKYYRVSMVEALSSPPRI